LAKQLVNTVCFCDNAPFKPLLGFLPSRESLSQAVGDSAQQDRAFVAHHTKNPDFLWR
jgi:hypothetical protein